MRRRDFFVAPLAAASLASCVRPRPESKLLPSLAPIPQPFEIALPIPPVAQMTRSDAVTDSYEIDVKLATARILAGFDTPIFGYGGVFPAPTIAARHGRRVSLKLRNRLPVPIVNHLHGGRTAPASDGYPIDFIQPDTQREYIYENDQRAATLWYHDHRLDFTGPQVWRGLAGFYILRDDEEDRLPLPRGGRDIPLMICDRSFNADGSFQYPSIDSSLLGKPGVTEGFMGGVLGDVILVNGAPWPKLEVANVKYRFRILNAANARRYEIALDPPGEIVQIGSDGGLLAAPVTQGSIQIAQAERFDVIIDFSKYPVGSRVTLLNRLDTGAMGRVMRFDIVRSEHDDTSIPSKLSDVPDPRPEDAVVTRDFDFSYSRFRHEWLINGRPFDPNRMDARPRLDSTEIWRLATDFNHPLHLHLVHFRILSHSGRPGIYDSGWKDTIDLGPGQAASILIPFRGYRGRYVFHCHNLEHEDMSMMANFEVI